MRLRQAFPNSALTLKKGRLQWEASLTPTALSRTYLVRVVYQQGEAPRVTVQTVLEGRPGEILPHTFSDGSLCLHEARDWRGWMWIVHSTVPWASEWLLNYEIWCVNGIWYGGGDWPPRRSVPGKPATEASDSSSSPANTAIPELGR